MYNNNLITEITKLKQLIATLQQQLQTQNWIRFSKTNRFRSTKKATNHWHFVGTDTTDKTFLLDEFITYNFTINGWFKITNSFFYKLIL